ncbi:ADP-ribosylglycohydrolase family protein [Aquipuribacter sp. SD81]|uniref:ADP-ribosylglycohydrolase family protein n=1 Tax=Aquipuribacter sp. SD81 TaxID=3127703 RepID=UPI00301A1A47
MTARGPVRADAGEGAPLVDTRLPNATQDPPPEALTIRVDPRTDPRLAGADVLRQRLSAARNVLVLTGAGVSVASGLPAYRTPATATGGPVSPYADDELPPELDGRLLLGSLPAVWSAWGPRRTEILAARPNAAHLAIAAWLAAAPTGARRTLVTQNVDDLHERAAGLPVTATATGGGPTESPVAHLHGQLLVSRCVRDPACHRAPDAATWSEPPSCPGCGGPLRPDVVLFGEPVDLDAQWQARRAVRACDVLLAVGTSGMVSSASALLRYARDVGALTVAVNPDHAAPDGLPLHGSAPDRYDVHVRAPAEVALPLLLADGADDPAAAGVRTVASALPRAGTAPARPQVGAEPATGRHSRWWAPLSSARPTGADTAVEAAARRAGDALLGCAVGDAHGERFFGPAGAALDLITRRVLPDPPPGGLRWTDDTLQHASVVAVLRRHDGEVPPDALAQHLALHLDVGRGYGRGSRELLWAVRLGADWRRESASLFGGGSWGNGAAMRSAAIGAWHAGDWRAARDVAARQAVVTHAHDEGRDGAAVVAAVAAVLAGSRGGDLPPRELLLAAADGSCAPGRLRDGITAAADLLARGEIGDDVETVRSVAGALGTGQEGASWDTVPFVLWSVLQAPDDLEATFWRTVTGLGDRDTTCAIACALVACRTGEDDTLRGWASRVEALPRM